MLGLLLTLCYQPPAPPQAPRPDPAPIIVVDAKHHPKPMKTAEERWMEAYREIQQGKRTSVNIGVEFPSGFLGFEDGIHDAFLQNGTPFLRLRPRPPQAPAKVLLTADPVPTQTFIPPSAVVCRT